MITGRFTTTAPLHVGCGLPTTHPLIKDDEGAEADVQAVVMDYRTRPCIPGTAVKGVLRAWAERFFPGHPAIARVFGSPDATTVNAHAGRADFLTAFVVEPTAADLQRYEKHLPYWRANRLTAVASSVCLDRRTGAAHPSKLFYHEFVPDRVPFQVQIDDDRLSDSDRVFLRAVLAQGAAHPTHPYQFGASGADGWGRVSWAPCPASLPPANGPTPADAPSHLRFDLTLEFRGPLLVNDPSRAKRKLADKATDTEKRENEGRTNFTALRRADGTVWLPASSFRGALRQRAEFLLRSIAPDATGDPNARVTPGGPVETLFGHTGQRARLTLTEFAEVGRCELRLQDFVAIDRFTGGAADGAKFDATFADRPTLRTRLVLDTAGLHLDAEGLLAAALRDVCRGDVPVGFGGAKGYGVAVGTLCEAGQEWMRNTLKLEPTATSPADATTAPAERLTADLLTIEPSNPGFFNYYLKSQQTGKKPSRADYKQISQDLAGQIGSDIPVEFAVEAGKSVRIRYRGKEYVPAAPPAPTAPRQNQPRLRDGVFAHPYYFLPLRDRESFTGELADGPPAGHTQYLPGRYSGTIRVRLTTETPLLVCAREEDPQAEHKTYPVLTDPDGSPRLASSSVRGMLRAAFEAVTNSRFGVFPFDSEGATLRQGNARRYGYRMNAGEGLSLVPARIENGHARLMLGTNPDLPTFDPSRRRWVVPQGLLHAAWVFRYRAGAGGIDPGAVKLNTQLPRHGQPAACWLELVQHHRLDKQRGQWVPDFSFWAVRHAAVDEKQLPAQSPPFIRDSQAYRSTRQVRKASGYFFVSNQNIDRKHDERFFFVTDEAATEAVVLRGDVKQEYLRLVEDYQVIHTDEVVARRKDSAPDEYLGREPGRTAFSRHVYEDDALCLCDGTLCYAFARKTGDSYSIEALYPVMISRRLHPQSPLDLVPKKLLPATSEAELSPADRVFGWVRQQDGPTDAEPAYRGHVRIGPVECLTLKAIEPDPELNPEPIPLAILGQPKPVQGRFYLGGKDGRALPNGIDKKEAGYTDAAGNRLRGPKVYPHHRRGLDDETWKGHERSSQNRSVRGWVRKGVEFEFDLMVTNLTEFELGGLLWVLSLKSGHFLRLGLGKPLGFGSVRAEVVGGTRLALGEEWGRAVYAPDPPADGADREHLAAEFEKSVSAAHPDLLKAFKTASAGWPDLPIHYPPPQPGQRAQQESGGEHYQWFVENERVSRKVNGRKLSLPDLTAADPSLPDVPT